MTERVSTSRAKQHPVDIAESYLVEPFEDGDIDMDDMKYIKNMIEDAIEEEEDRREGGA